MVNVNTAMNIYKGVGQWQSSRIKEHQEKSHEKQFMM